MSFPEMITWILKTMGVIPPKPWKWMHCQKWHTLTGNFVEVAIHTCIPRVVPSLPHSKGCHHPNPHPNPWVAQWSSWKLESWKCNNLVRWGLYWHSKKGGLGWNEREKQFGVPSSWSSIGYRIFTHRLREWSSEPIGPCPRFSFVSKVFVCKTMRSSIFSGT